jgi:hypothetical protein
VTKEPSRSYLRERGEASRRLLVRPAPANGPYVAGLQAGIVYSDRRQCQFGSRCREKSVPIADIPRRGRFAWEVRVDLPGWRWDAVIVVTRLAPLHL